MPEYGKKTVAELQEILKGRSLPHTGKKADLVARLNEADKSIEAKPVAPEPPPAPQPIQAAVEKTKPIAEPEPVKQRSATTAATDGIPDKSTLIPPQTIQTEREGSATTDTRLANAADYSLGLDQSSLENEMKKRKARAERFGAPAEELDEQARKAEERAKRFGTGAVENGGVAKLDEALPVERERRAKRGRDGENALDDPGLKQAIRGKRQFQGKGARYERRGERPTGVQKAVGNSTSTFSSEKDRLAAEARKKKFAAG